MHQEESLYRRRALNNSELYIFIICRYQVWDSWSAQVNNHSEKPCITLLSRGITNDIKYVRNVQLIRYTKGLFINTVETRYSWFTKFSWISVFRVASKGWNWVSVKERQWEFSCARWTYHYSFCNYNRLTFATLTFFLLLPAIYPKSWSLIL